MKLVRCLKLLMCVKKEQGLTTDDTIAWVGKCMTDFCAFEYASVELKTDTLTKIYLNMKVIVDSEVDREMAEELIELGLGEFCDLKMLELETLQDCGSLWVNDDYSLAEQCLEPVVDSKSEIRPMLYKHATLEVPEA